jgi:hypothetical protein
MKITYIISKLRPALSAVLQYWIAHSASRAAMKKTYRREWQEKGSASTSLAEISIFHHGALYEVNRAFYLDGRLQREESWLATYGWHSNGHLIALGRSGYLIFDPFSKLLYLEEWVGDDKQLEVYHQINDEL